MTLYTTLDTPIGELMLTGDDEALTGLYLPNSLPTPRADWRRDEARFAAATAQLREYFAGERSEFDLELRLEGGAFERQVWEELLRIGYGETVSYGEIARRVGHPGSARAVGAANGRNPIAIIVPCHRVIGADGSLTGYGGGLECKRTLLDLEAGTPALPQIS
jgi:methylated-DNA-[protein]-cysteine S-methyltransferase